uniref:Uncharacterized protein n=1 Tax=Anguilla anguilla TaxID=7936 RepID=A0A0E9T0V5_ANGAN
MAAVIYSSRTRKSQNSRSRFPRADSRAGGGACADRSWCRITALEPVRPHNESSLSFVNNAR